MNRFIRTPHKIVEILTTTYPRKADDPCGEIAGTGRLAFVFLWGLPFVWIPNFEKGQDRASGYLKKYNGIFFLCFGLLVHRWVNTDA